MGETVPQVLNTARAVCLDKQIITRVSKKDERIDELDAKAAGKNTEKVFFGGIITLRLVQSSGMKSAQRF